VRVLIVHNYYQSTSPSGEDMAFDIERRLLEGGGYEVSTFTRHNDDIGKGPFDRMAATGELFWSRRTRRELDQLIRRQRPEIAHFHNTFPLISASAYQACRDHGVPIVQTLHNYRLVCPGALLLRDGKPCEDCIGRLPLPAITHGCYRGSRAGSALVTGMLAVNRARHVYTDWVDQYVCLTEFARARFTRAGLPPGRLTVKANAMVDPPPQGRGEGGYALYVGRLSPEKGVSTLLRAWQGIDYPLKILGDGDLRASLERAAAGGSASIEFLGRRPNREVMALMGEATLLVIPSECYEGVPVTVLEALASGVPLLVSAIGALDELVDTPQNGLKFSPGDAEGLRDGAVRLLREPETRQAMRHANRERFERQYSPEQALAASRSLYQQVITRAGAAARTARG
jgi:glycosyltransferase involved in cell wall biosynthesis